MPKTSLATKRTNAVHAIRGVKKRFSRSKKHVFLGKAYAVDEIVAIFQAQIDALDALEAAHVAVKQAVAKERKVAKHVRGFTLVLKSWVLGRYGARVDVLGDFGWEAVKKPGPKTVMAKLEGVRKRREGKGSGVGK